VEFDTFNGLPLDGQLAALGDALDTGLGDAERLLQLTAEVSDHAPLAWLSLELVRRGYLASETAREQFAGFLCALGETAVNRILKAINGETWPAETGRHIATTLVRALERVPIQRLTSLCLMDRALKHNYTEDRDAHVHRMREQVRGLLASGNVGDVTVDMLAHVRAEAVAELDAVAAEAGVDEPFRALRLQLARETVRVLGEVPKAVSQSNAEELLSRRVYTDPGHFLIELLQNAEDTGATTWKLVFDADRIIVWHDGKPFDARDVVGVCSIGQTTKRKSQIGFFGVGFKSVYEVTARPQIYSDVYAFEIADVSIPKALSGRPSHLPQTGTVLLLPLKDPSDPVRTPRKLFEHAASLDPCVLLTLRSMATLDLSLTAAAGGPEARVVTEIGAERVRTLREQPGDRARRYALESAEARWPGGARESGRADRTEVMVGLRLSNDTSLPVPVPPDDHASTVYSFLPTEERSGLRFFVQSHFDVPVDRERVNNESPWNAWIVEQVPARLAHLATALLAEAGSDVDRLAVARGVLDCLPLAAEVKSPSFVPLPPLLGRAFQEVSCVPGMDGGLHTPRAAVVVSNRLSALFEDGRLPGEVVGRRGETLALADPLLDERALEVLTLLGARRLDVEQLVRALERALGDHPDGEVAPPTSWLSGFDDDHYRILYELLLEEIEALQHAGKQRLADGLAERLRRLPLVVSEGGGLFRPGQPSTPRRAKADIRTIYGDAGVFVASRLDALTPDTPADWRTADFMTRMGVEATDVEQLLADLPRLHANVVMAPDRLATLFQVLADAPWRTARGALAYPLFPATDGGFYGAARGADDRDGVVRADRTEFGAGLEALYGASRPVLDHQHPCFLAAQQLLEQALTPALDVECLVSDMATEPPLLQLQQDDLLHLHLLLNSQREELPERLKRGLARAPIWPVEGSEASLPLKGPAAARVPSSDAIRELLPDVSFLHRDVRDLAHVADMKVDAVSTADVVKACGRLAKPPMRIDPNAENLARVHTYLLDVKDKVQQSTRDRIATTPLFLDDQGEVVRLEEACWTTDTVLRELYRGDTGRHFLGPDSSSLAVVGALGLGEQLDMANASTLVEDLWQRRRRLLDRTVVSLKDPLVSGVEGLAAVHAYLAEHARSLSAEALVLAKQVPMYPDALGKLGVLTNSEALKEPRHLVAVASDRTVPLLAALNVRVLDAEASRRLAPLLFAMGHRSSDVQEAMQVIAEAYPHRLARWDRLRREARPLVVAFLGQHAGDIDAALGGSGSPERGYPMLNLLRLWIAADGELVSASEVTTAGALEGLDGVEGLMLSEDSARELAGVAPLMAPASLGDVLERKVYPAARDATPLKRQPAPLQTLDGILTLADKLRGEMARSALPLVDAQERLRVDTKLGRASVHAAALTAGTPLAEDLLHPQLHALDAGPRIADVPPLSILQAYLGLPKDEQQARRGTLYAWLEADERAIMSDADCRQQLRTRPLFPSSRGTLLAAQDLIIDAELPDLGVDWTPADDIPAAVLSLVARHLDVGKPPLEELVERHLRPAYDRAVEFERHAEALTLVTYFAHRLAGAGGAEVRALLPSLPLQGQGGDYRDPEDLYLPTIEAAEDAHAVFDELGQDTPFVAGTYAGLELFLRSLGVRDDPPIEAIEAAVEPSAPVFTLARSAALARLLDGLEDDELSGLALATSSWVVDDQGASRRCRELFAPEPEVEALVGTAPGRFPHPQVWRALGSRLRARIGFRGVDAVTLEDVASHIVDQSARGAVVPFRVYLWLEEGLRAGWLSPAEVNQRFANQRWVCDDAGDWFAHEAVVGIRALSYFGPLRGYWQQGAERCPNLCAAFSIPTVLDGGVLLHFLRELGARVAKEGDQTLLRTYPALPRMLLACFAWLGARGRALPGDVPVVLATALGPSVHPGHRLIAAADPLLFVSDTPQLERQFGGVGDFYSAARGGLEDRAAIDDLLERSGVRRLRACLTWVVQQRGGDVTPTHRGEVGQLCGLLGDLAGALPRVRAFKQTLSDGAWAWQSRLSSIVERQAVRVIDDLAVMMALPGVGEVESQDKVAWDRGRNTLLVDVEVVRSPSDFTVDLANGVLPAVYDGPGSEQLTELLHILLGAGGAAGMKRYLDRQRYPVVDAEAPKRGLNDRVQELLDFGLHLRLARRFTELDAADFGQWRAVGDDAGSDPGTIARRLLDAAGAHEPSPELEKTLQELLTAPDLSRLPPSLLQDQDAHAGAFVPPRAVGSPLGEPQSPTRDDAGATSSVAAQAPRPQLPAYPEPPEDLEPPRRGFWSRVGRWLSGRSDADEQAEAIERWLNQAAPWAQSANPFEERPFIGPQLWANGTTLQQAASIQSTSQLRHRPEKVPAPYGYVNQVLGASFQPRSQRWLPTHDPTRYDRLSATGERVRFEGFLGPGTSRLPLPMYSRLVSGPQADGTALQVARRSPSEIAVTNPSDQAVPMVYEVELLEVPELGGRLGPVPEDWRTPTLTRTELPTAVQAFLAATESEVVGDFARARAAHVFARDRYEYDIDFQRLPAVRKTRRKLRPGVGNHHLQLLHAGADEQWLGRGICYELNVLVVELLRHLGVPALVGTGWFLDEGRVGRPDHLWALAVLGSEVGPCLFPLDASDGPTGPRRPMAGMEQPEPPARFDVVPTLPEFDTPTGAWGDSGLGDMSQRGPHLAPDAPEAREQAHQRALRERAEELRAAIGRVARHLGREVPPSARSTRVDEALVAALQRDLSQLLGSEALGAVYLNISRGRYRSVRRLPDAVGELVGMGLVEVSPAEVFDITPT